MAAHFMKRIATSARDITSYQQEGNYTPDSDKDPSRTVLNLAAASVPFFTPAQNPPAGTAIAPEDGSPLPKLFTPLRIRGIVMPNRIWVSPMCQYSAHEGFNTPWHLIHYGGMAQRGPGLVMLEATSVQARGRITPEDSGIYLDAHVDTLRRQVQFAHSQNALIGIQLAHAGRKASTVAPWLASSAAATVQAGGWPDDVIGPCSEPYDENHAVPRSMTLKDIGELKDDFVKGARRAVEAGFDVIELHFAHGYLLASFLSPTVNKRADQYGGSFENRTRLGLELVEEVRAVIPETMPLFVRISATDLLENNPDFPESWTVQDSARFAVLLAERGVDVLDVSTGGTHSAQKLAGGFAYQAPFSKYIKRAVGDSMLVCAVGRIDSGKLAEQIITGSQSEEKEEEDTPLDLIAVGRPFLKNPGLVWAWADELGVEIQVAHQIGWGFKGRSGQRRQHAKAVQ